MQSKRSDERDQRKENDAALQCRHNEERNRDKGNEYALGKIVQTNCATLCKLQHLGLCQAYKIPSRRDKYYGTHSKVEGK